MSPAANMQLGGFEQRLLTELRAVVAEQAAPDAVAPRALRRTPRWSLAAGCAAAAAACAAVLIAASAGSSPSLAQAFPILARPASAVPPDLAGFLRSNGASAQRAKLDLRHARPFHTPLGIGYVLTDVKTDLICVAAPGFGKTWGASCGSARRATRLGVGDLATYGPQGVSFVDVLPKGATATIRRAGGPERAAKLRDGVLAFVTDRSTTVTARIDGQVTTLRIPVPTRPARIPVPSRAQVAAAVRLRFAGKLLVATFRARYPSRRGVSTYALEVDQARGRATASELSAPTGNVAAGGLVRLSIGAPTAPGRWRVTVFYAVPTGAVRYPSQWPPVLGNVAVAPKGSGAQIVATRVIRVRAPKAGAGRGPRISRSGG
jgi:hypothetical protein